MVYHATNGVRLFHPVVTPDGRGVTFCQETRFVSGVSETALYYLPLSGDRTLERLGKEPMDDWCLGSVSADGKWLAYVVNEGGTNIYLRRFRAPGGPLRNSEHIGYHPIWSRDGTQLIYANKQENEGSWVPPAMLRPKGQSLEVVRRERIAALPGDGLFDVSPDGTHILVVEPRDGRVQLVVTTNWLPQLRARLAGRQ